jgi:hypothetical protein
MGVPRPTVRRTVAAFRACAVLALAAATVAATNSAAQPARIPAGTQIRFHLTAPVSSNESKTGQAFGFALLDPVLVDGKVVAAIGATGGGTLLLAGPAGSKGHEGDLTLRIDSVAAVDGGKIVFDNQHFEVNGVNEKLASTVAGFIPFVGFFAQFMRGQDEHLKVSDAIQTTLLRPAIITPPPPICAPPSPTSSPSPAASPTPCMPPPPCGPGVRTASPLAPTDSPPGLPLPAAAQTPCAPVVPIPWVTPYRYASPPAAASPSAAVMPAQYASAQPEPAATRAPVRVGS